MPCSSPLETAPSHAQSRHDRRCHQPTPTASSFRWIYLVFKGWGPFPGVTGARNQTGPWDAVGQTRNPELTDGSTAFEMLTEITPGHSFAYETTGFTNMLGRLIEGVRGEWTFTPDGTGTLIRWAYEFKPLPGRHLVLKWIVVPLWRHYMQNGLTNSARVAQERTPVA
jgi:Polyketide cyclase / dehydrase and lipid transport